MSGWVQYLELKAKSKIGLSSGVIIWAAIAVLCAAITLGFVIFTAFVWLAERYDPLTAALVLSGFFLLITVIAAVASLMAHRRTMTQAKIALAERSQQPWFDPKYVAVGLQIARSVGWRRLIPLAAVAILAGALAKEYSGSRPADADDELDEDEQEDQDEAA